MNNGSIWDNAGPVGRVLIGIFLAAWIIAALVPGIAMLSKPFACAIGATETWCPEQ